MGNPFLRAKKRKAADRAVERQHEEPAHFRSDAANARRKRKKQAKRTQVRQAAGGAQDANWHSLRADLSRNSSQSISTSPLHHELCDFAAWVQPTPAEDGARTLLIGRIEQLVTQKWQHALVTPFGSRVASTSTFFSDVDLMLFADPRRGGGGAAGGSGSDDEVADSEHGSPASPTAHSEEASEYGEASTSDSGSDHSGSNGAGGVFKRGKSNASQATAPSTISLNIDTSDTAAASPFPGAPRIQSQQRHRRMAVQWLLGLSKLLRRQVRRSFTTHAHSITH
jgi:hypothetical protein